MGEVSYCRPREQLAAEGCRHGIEQVAYSKEV